MFLEFLKLRIGVRSAYYTIKAGTMTQQSRIAPRKRTNNAGIIDIRGKEYAVVLRDASKAGVRLRLTRPVDLPERFKLSVPMEKIDTECVLVWRRGNDIGVRFASDAAR